MSVCHRLLLISVHVPSPSRVPQTLSRRRRHKRRFATGAAKPDELLNRHGSLGQLSNSTFVMRSEPFSPTPRRAPGRVRR